MHQTSLRKMKQFVNKYLDENKTLRILDVGSQDVNGTYKIFFEKEKWFYQGSDLEKGKNVDIELDSPYDWSNIDDETYDVVISGQCFEHIEYFWITILEMRRVLKERGYICIIAPSSGPEHRYPVDCWRFYPDGFRTVSKIAKLEVIELYTEWNIGQWQDTFMVCRKNEKDQEFDKWKYKYVKSLSDDHLLYNQFLKHNKTNEEIKTLKETINLMRNTKRWRWIEKINKLIRYKQ